MYTHGGVGEYVLRKMSADNRGKEDNRSGWAALAGFGGGMIANRVLGAGARNVAKKGLLDVGAKVDTAQLLNKLKLQEAAAGLPRTSVPTESMSAYIPDVPDYLKKSVGNERLHLPDKANPFITAHEVGHASGGKFRKALMRNRLPITVASRLGGLGLLGHAALTGEKGEGMGATGYAAPAVAGVLPLVVQGEELAATLKAKKLLRNAKVKVPGLGKMMRSQQLNYLLGNLGMVAPVGLGAYALHRYLKPKKDARANA